MTEVLATIVIRNLSDGTFLSCPGVSPAVLVFDNQAEASKFVRSHTCDHGKSALCEWGEAYIIPVGVLSIMFDRYCHICSDGESLCLHSMKDLTKEGAM